MDINIKTKFSIGDTVYFVKESTSYYEIPCTHCGGNYREIVNNIEYKCGHCGYRRYCQRGGFQVFAFKYQTCVGQQKRGCNQSYIQRRHAIRSVM